jgi:hypothetical protein
MYIVSFHAIFNENANILAHRLGVPFIQNMNVNDNDIIIVFGAHECADQLLDLQNKVNVEYIIIQTEQYNSKVFDNKYYYELLKRNSALDWSKENIRRLKKQFPTPFYGVYFYDCFMSESTPEFDSRPIDFFFCGSKNADRELLLNDFKEKNAHCNIEFDLSYSYTNQLELNEKLKQVKYVINLPFYKENALETQRIHKALSMGCRVVSLLSGDRDMNEQYRDYVYFVPRLTDFSLLIENPPKKTYMQLMEHFGAYQIQTNIEGIKFAEKKLNEKLEQKKLTQNSNGDSPIQVLL